MTERRAVTIGIPYPGAVISVNHYRGRSKDGGEYVKAEAKAWMDALGWLLKSYHVEDWRLPLHVTCSGMFQDAAHAPDLSNLSKCTLDAIEEVTGVNDRNFRWHDGSLIYKKDERPEIIIEIKEAADAGNGG
jgi:Holliday junction resolvase RusA-like endonuclease